MLRFFLSDDPVLSADDLLLDERVIQPLEIGESVRIEFRERARDRPDGKFVIALVDATNVVPNEPNEDNAVPSRQLP